MSSDHLIKSVSNAVLSSSSKHIDGNIYNIILYGSYARGDAHTGSDIDIAVLTDISPEQCSIACSMIFNDIWDFCYDNDIFVDITVINSDIFSKYSDIHSLYSSIKQEGVSLVV